MNPGLTEVAQTAVSGLAKSPLAITIVFVNLLVFGGVFWLVDRAADRLDRRFDNAEKRIGEIIAICIKQQ